jgi:hypothetical protein
MRQLGMYRWTWLDRRAARSNDPKGRQYAGKPALACPPETRWNPPSRLPLRFVCLGLSIVALQS